MRLRWLTIGVLALAAGCAHKGKSGEDDESNEVRMTLDQVPAAARAALEREANGATITTVDKETDHGKTVYETDVMLDGKNWEIKVDESGNLVGKKIDDEEGEKQRK